MLIDHKVYIYPDLFLFFFLEEVRPVRDTRVRLRLAAAQDETAGALTRVARGRRCEALAGPHLRATETTGAGAGATDPSSSTGSPTLPLPRLTERQCMLASAKVRGFAFTEKRFLEMQVDNLRDIAWNERCFDQLVLPARQKELVQAVVVEHTQQQQQRRRHPGGGGGGGGRGFDDIVKGKGLGLVPAAVHGLVG